MGDFPRSELKYTGTGGNCNIVIAVIFYPVNNLLMHIIWVCKHPDFKEYIQIYFKNV